MQLKWVGAIIVGLVFVTSMVCIGGVILLGVTQSDGPSGDHVAVVKVHGSIMTRDQGGLFAADGASAERLVAELREIREDGSAQAVLLDVDSPGGTALASEQIHAEILRVQDAGIPVVAYFGTSATSGAYYVSAPAEVIVANAATVTGSIGVIAQVPNLEELYEKIGIEMQVIAVGEFKDMMQPSRSLTEEERQIIVDIQMETYDAFVAVIANGRDMTEDEVRELADGRVYSGLQALDNGLVDEIGDYSYAVSVAGELAGLGDDPPLRDYSPSAPGFWDIFFGVTGRDIQINLPGSFDLPIDPRDVHLEIRTEAQ
ncbi:MAG: signal peptide peptidase SppA [Sphaerobacteraceae bacterium]|nr:MAG: signal peptide peptidase SppA [Sphaerobacteraceae bacterium]